MQTAGEILGQNYNSAGHYGVITGGYTSMGISCYFEQSGLSIWCVVFR